MKSIENTFNNKIRFRQKIANTKDWADDFILLSGEIGIEICEDKSKKVKIGDGNTPWSDLDYIVVDIDLSNIISEINKIQIEVDEATLAAERLQYYGDSSIVPTDISYFTYEAMEDEYGNLSYYIITGLTDEGKFLEEIIIPYQIDGINVTEIGSEAFIGYLFLKTVILPNSIKNIQGAAFFGCQALTGINIPDSVIFIGSSVFTGCTSLTTINIPNSVTFMNSTFDGIENSIAIICNQGSYTESYAKENGIKYILDTVDPNEYEEKLAWERLVFERLQYYGDANILPSDTNLFTYVTGKAANKNGSLVSGILITGINVNPNTTIQTLVIPYEINGYKVIGINSSAFLNYGKIENVILPNTISLIGNSAFKDCALLHTINLDDVLKIENNAFSGCINLLNINITSASLIGSKSFSSCARLKSIMIGETTIQASAFYNCTRLKDINFISDINDKPNNEAMIYSNAFEGCLGLKNINLPNYIFYIYESAFKDCVNLERIFIPTMYDGSDMYIEDNVFEGCAKITIVCDQGSSIETYAKDNGINYILDTVNPEEYAAASDITRLQTKMGDEPLIGGGTLSEAINLNYENIGAMGDLLTNTSSLVDAINVNYNNIADLQSQMGVVATILEDIKADQEALINGGEE